MDSSSNPNPHKRPPEVDEVFSEMKRIKPEDLLDLLEAEEAVTEEVTELESVIQSFEEEIAGDGELGFLLHASDDELGLPPQPCDTPEKLAPAKERESEVELGFEGDGMYRPLDLAVELTWPLDLAAELTWQVMPAVELGL